MTPGTAARGVRYAPRMPLGRVPSTPGPAPKPPAPSSNQSGRGYSSAPGIAPTPTGSRAYSQTYPGVPNQTPGQTTPGTTSAYNDPYINAFGVIQGAQSDQLMQQYLNGLGMAEGLYGLNADYRNAMANNDLAKLAQQQYRDIDLGKERNAANLGFAQRGFDIDSRGNLLNRDMKYRSNESEAAAAGSITSGGFQQTNRDILGQYGIAQDTTQLALDKTTADLNLDNKAIDSLAKEYGVRKDDVLTTLKFGITQLGLDWTQAQQQLAQQLASGDAALQMNALNFMQQIMALPAPAVSIGDTFPGGLPGEATPGQVAQASSSQQPYGANTVGGDGTLAPASNRPVMIGTPGLQ